MTEFRAGGGAGCLGMGLHRSRSAFPRARLAKATGPLTLLLFLLLALPTAGAQSPSPGGPTAARSAPGQPTATSDPSSRPAPGPQVALSGRFGQRALLVIDGVPRTLAVGESSDGVRLLGWRDDQAEVRIGDQRLMLRVGAAPVDLGQGRAAGPGREAAGRVVLQADEGGHFIGNGSINGRSTRFMIDTGATLVALSQAEADRLGIAFRQGARGMANTANGEVPVHRVMLESVRVGAVEVPMLEAVIMPAAMPHVLLGNNFLERFTLQREGRTMTLQRRP